jgi:hypothetical protein
MNASFSTSEACITPTHTIMSDFYMNKEACLSHMLTCPKCSAMWEILKTNVMENDAIERAILDHTRSYHNV